MFYEINIESKEVNYCMSETTLEMSLFYYHKDFPTYYDL